MGAGWTAYAGHHRSVLIAGGSSFTFLLGRADIFGLYVRMIGMQFYSRFAALLLSGLFTSERICASCLVLYRVNSMRWSHQVGRTPAGDLTCLVITC